MAKLTQRQRRFCDEYLIDLNATQAAIRAGYSIKTAGQIADRLLKNVKIQQCIQERLAEKDAECVATQDEVLEFLTAVLRGEITEEVPILVGDGEQRLKPKGTSIKDRVRAAELLAKRYGLLADKFNVTVERAPRIVDDIGEPDDDALD